MAENTGDRDINDALEDLHGEIHRAETEDEASLERLHELGGEVGEAIEAADAQRYRSLRERLQHDIAHFEVSHPTLTAAASRVIDTLSNAGI